ncbi:substrate-binding domain-containing protein [Saccharothrix australiensis]|uniref:Extracellular solute-binding protein n=1 Tax=Saccharothrix australiensis TaxID=2072 RepID=A0A495VV23_9PSEU|nr:substrate-binding domain-containing protein [Saccharothrix australiensis]RKT53246.1 extracellular solute-binding protein [Saccharothrix australiensis]
MGTPRPAVHRTILAVDVSGFGARDLSQQQAIRHGLYEALVGAFAECGVEWTDDWHGTYHEDRGDGLFVLVPAGVPNSRVVSTLPHALVGRLRRHNATSAPEARIRLRAAITAGEVLNDGNGVMGDGLVLAFRLLDCAPLRAELAQHPGVLALIVSDRFFQDVVRPDPACDPDSYGEVAVDVKEVRGTAWICRPDHPPPPPPPPGRRARPRWSVSALTALLALPLLCDALLAAPVPPAPCPEPVQLNVLTSTEKQDVVRELAAAFEDGSGRLADSGCKQADVQVTDEDSATVAAVLSRGWPDDDLALAGPEPHVWLPDTEWEVEEVRRTLAAGGRTDVELTAEGAVAHSPLVLGVAPARARERTFQWRDLAAFRPLAAVDAADSGADLAAAAALARSALGVTALDAGALRGAGVARRLRDVALRTAPSRGDVCPAADRAVLASEKTVRDLTCLVPLYAAEGTLHLDHPFVSVRRPDRPRSARRDRVVGLFREHLFAQPAQEAFRLAGFRDRDWTPEPHPDVPRERQRELAVTVEPEALRPAWQAANRPSRVVLAVDGTERAVRLADLLTERVAARGEVLRLDFSPAELASVVERAVDAHGADPPVVVLSGVPRPAVPRREVSTAPVTVFGVGFAPGACSATDQLGAFRSAYRGNCHEEPDVDRALDALAEELWGARG